MNSPTTFNAVYVQGVRKGKFPVNWIYPNNRIVYSSSHILCLYLKLWCAQSFSLICLTKPYPHWKLYKWHFQLTKQPSETWLPSLLTMWKRNTCGPSLFPLQTRLSSESNESTTSPWTCIIHWSRSLSGTPKSLKELVTEQVLTTGTFISKKKFVVIDIIRLLIKTAILMPEAQNGEVTIVEVETEGFNKAKVDGRNLLS